MANATTPTLLSLDQYADIMGIDPRHFNQIYSASFPVEGACDDVWYQWAWQSADRVSREDLARAIAQAERLIAQYVGFWPAPAWTAGEIHRYPYQRRVSDGMMGTIFFPDLVQDRRRTIKSEWKYYADGGRRTVDPIELDADIDYSNPDGDGFDEIATISTTFTDIVAGAEYEVAVFAGTDTADENRIRNLTVTLGLAGAITITGQSSLFVDPTLWQVGDGINGDVPGNFLVTANIYRIYTSDEDEALAPVEFAWQRSTSTLFQVSYGTLQLWNPELGIITPIPATWDSTNEIWVPAPWSCLEDEPYLARIWYYSGWATNLQGRMSEPFARAVAALATALLAKQICGCGQSERLFQFWQQLPTTESGAELVSFARLDNPWGSMRGAWEAYRVCWGYVDVDGVSV